MDNYFILSKCYASVARVEDREVKEMEAFEKIISGLGLVFLAMREETAMV